jgi:hypothetical protein
VFAVLVRPSVVSATLVLQPSTRPPPRLPRRQTPESLSAAADATHGLAGEPRRFVHERYRNSEALIEHTAHLGGLGEEILATGTVSGELLGAVSPDLRAKLTDSPVRLFSPFLSM